jgi:1,4-dihydroxy-2-naphthoate octaprenyltransferase
MPKHSQQYKPLGEFTKRDWQKFIPGFVFFGVFIFGLGIYSKTKEAIWLGLILVGIGIIAGFILHFFFGIKIINLRRDFKNKKY